MAAAGGGGEGKAAGIDLKCINTVRALAADMVEEANSGHPGAPMGCAPMAHVLWGSVMNYDPSAPKWINRDRFVLSNGHACALLYSMLHVTGYDLPMDELKKFRQIHSITAGHPENELHPAIEVSTGPLGQGISNAVGMALAQRNLAATYNKDDIAVFDSSVFVICGDGCLQEGVSSEASSLAGHWGLGQLVVLYDDNKITIDGSTELSFTEDVLKRYEAYGWHTQSVEDGDSDIGAIATAVAAAKAETTRPSIIKVSTRIGFGSSKEGSESAHGAPLGADVLSAFKEKLGLKGDEKFAVAGDVMDFYKGASERGVSAHKKWQETFEAYKGKYPAEAADIERRFSGALPEDIVASLPRFTPADKADATRNLSGKALNALAERLPEMFGGSADLTPSNKTLLKITGDFQKETPAGRYIRFGVREHAMTSIANGIAAFGGHLPFVATFLNFIGYAAGAARVTALSHFRVLFVATHDSIGLGEDGPTHQPVEMLLMLRGMPNMDVYRPADGNETSASYGNYATRPGKPAVVALSRQNLPQLEGSSVEAAMRGGYMLQGGDGEGKPDLILCATGSEVCHCVEAAKLLTAEGGAAAGKRVAIVSLPCQEVFMEQDEEYRRSVFVPGSPVLTVEAACSLGWERFGHGHHGVDTFGLSGPGPAVYEHFKLTPEGIADKATRLMARYAGAEAPAVHAVNPAL